MYPVAELISFYVYYVITTFSCIHNDEHHTALDAVLVAAMLDVVLSHTPQVWKMHCKTEFAKQF